MTEISSSFDSLWNAILDVGQDKDTRGYRRFAWSDADLTLREWFRGCASARGMDVEEDRNGNLWAWWLPPGWTGEPRNAFVTGSHLDSVPDGGAFDGPLGVVSAFAAIDLVRDRGVVPTIPVAVAAFSDEEGARFGVACVGSQLVTGALSAERARGLRDNDGVTLAEALARAGRNSDHLGVDDEVLGRIGVYVELHVEQGRALDLLDRPIAVASAIWPHGRWEFVFGGAANHAGTTRLVDRRDPMLAFASSVHAARTAAERHEAVATFGKVLVSPNGANAIPSRVRAWLDARAADESTLTALVEQISAEAEGFAATDRIDLQVTVESITPIVEFPHAPRVRLQRALARLGDVPVLPTQAGHDAGILSAKVPTAMLFVRNPTGVSHSPEEYAESADCHIGAEALADGDDGLGDVTDWWCEHAWLGGDTVADRVLIAVSDGRIVTIEADTVRPASARLLSGLVVPGLANAHSHAFHRALRSRTQRDRGSFWTWRDLMYRTAARLDPDGYRRLARAVYAEMACAGITSVGEFHYLHHDVGGAAYADPNEMGHALIAGAADAGVRLTLLDTCYLSSGVDGAPLAAGPQQRFGDGSGDGWAQRVETLHQQVVDESVIIGAAIHSVRGVPLDHMPAVVEWADAHDAPLHVHSSEQTAEIDQCLAVHGATPTALLRDAGVLGPRTTAVHATHLTGEDVADLDRTATGVCFCPTTERDLGDGIGPAAALLAGRGPFSLGSDSHAVIDLFEEARATELDERLARRERGIITSERLLGAATLDGQRALGWMDAGTLAVGARADLVAVDVGSMRTAGGGATVENVVFAATAADVTDVVVDGRIVVSDRRHYSVDDVGASLAESISELMVGEYSR